MGHQLCLKLESIYSSVLIHLQFSESIIIHCICGFIQAPPRLDEQESVQNQCWVQEKKEHKEKYLVLLSHNLTSPRLGCCLNTTRQKNDIKE
jgi:hypothetical protein